jgi:pSer/pThr/pTyr-binding forkhead associated (FHA) protein
VCPQCGTTNNKGFKFCGTCGTPLANVGAPAAPVPQAPMPAAGGGGGQGTLVLIRPDGTEGESISIANRGIVGREAMPQFSNDSYLSPRHASFTFAGGTLTVKDESSLNGIYLRIERDAPIELEDRAIFRVGQEIVRLEMLKDGKKGPDGVEPMGSPREGLVGRICLLTGRETTGNCYSIPTDGLHLGRERGDILFPDDGYVSGLHARLHWEGGKVFLTDVGSSNGTFIRIKGEQKVTSGSMLLMGQQLFRIEY